MNLAPPPSITLIMLLTLTQILFKSPRLTSSFSLSPSSRLFSAPPTTPAPRLQLDNSPLQYSCGLSPRSITANLPILISSIHSRYPSNEVKQSELIEILENVVEFNKERAHLVTTRDYFLKQRKLLSTQVANAMKAKDFALADTFKRDSTLCSSKADDLNSKVTDLDVTLKDLIAQIPNPVSDVTPLGVNADDNVVVSQFGDPNIDPVISKSKWSSSFKPKWHDTIMSELCDSSFPSHRAAKMSGARFSILQGQSAQLERALTSFFLDLAISRGYIEVSVPLIVGRNALEGTGQLPKFESDLFKISDTSHTCNGLDAFLIPTAEVPLTNLHANEILSSNELPLKYVSATQCFRGEAGTHGKDVRGLIRNHQFLKVELVKVCKPEESEKEWEELTKDAKECLTLLNIPHRRLLLCTGDISFGASSCYDLEVWLPGSGEWREISSCSNMKDFQALKMKTRYRTDETNGAEVKFVHTINGSALAVGRAVVAVVENYQNEDGSVTVPEVLRKYMGGKEFLR